jgi:hypothetical protein
MLKRALVFALTLLAAGIGQALEATTSPLQQSQSPWLRTESRRFEIHYQRALAPDLARVVRSAEAAYYRISGRLNFVLATKVPLVVFASSGPMTQEQVAEYAISDQVAPQRPHRSRLVLPLSNDSEQLDARLVHELTHVLAFEIVWPPQSWRRRNADALGVQKASHITWSAPGLMMTRV